MDHRLQSILQGQYENYLAPFLWLHNEDDSLILRELDRIYACGIRAVCLESRTHEEFCRDDWWSDCRLIMDYCRAHDMKVWILDDKHFPSGYANGIYEKRQDLVQWNIVERHMDVPGPVVGGSVYADEWAMGDELLSVFACRHIPNTETLSDEIIDLSDKVAEGYVYLDLPEGMWRIVFLVKTRKGLNGRVMRYSDKLRLESTQAYIDEVYESHYQNLAEYFGNTFLGFFSDEPEFGNETAGAWVPTHKRLGFHHPWHDSVRAHFTALYGDNAMRNLLAMWFDFDGLPYEEYRIAYMNFITDEYARCFTSPIADWCHAHGVRYIGHVIEDNHIHYGTVHGTGHYFKSLRSQDMAGIDVVLHQIMPGLTECNSAACVSYKHADATFFNYTLAKLGSSLAHITPHMHRQAMCEIFGAYGWGEGTRTMKYLADHMLVRGINYFVPHAFSPKPHDPDCPPNFYASGENPQYKYFGELMGYMNRVCHLLAGSIHQSTCAILYDAEHVWSGRDHVCMDRIAKELYDHQLDFDILPIEALDDMDADRYINGERYEILLVPGCDYMRPAVRCRLDEQLRRSGLRVIVVTDPPISDADFISVPLEDVARRVRAMNAWDVESTVETPYLRYHHAVRDGAHIYLFTNEDIRHTIDTTVTLRDFSGGAYIHYDAFADRAEAVTSSDTTIHLTLPPYGSVCILCGAVSFDGLPTAPAPAALVTRTLTPIFAVSLCEQDGEPFVPYKEIATLRSLSGPGERPRFSGTAKYETTLSLTAADTVLDLGDVGETAEVILNGRPVGTRLFPPYRFDISGIARDGENELVILVTNTLGHRIHDGFSKFLLLRPTGLLGPVTVSATV